MFDLQTKNEFIQNISVYEEKRKFTYSISEGGFGVEFKTELWSSTCVNLLRKRKMICKI